MRWASLTDLILSTFHPGTLSGDLSLKLEGPLRVLFPSARIKP